MKEKDTSLNEGIACRRIVDHRIYFVFLVIACEETRQIFPVIFSIRSLHRKMLGKVGHS